MYNIYIIYVKWQGTLVDIVDSRILQLKYFHCSEFSNFTVFDKEKLKKKIGTVKIIKAPVRFELMTYIFVLNFLTYCS